MMLALVALLSITCTFGGLLPGAAASGKLTDAIISIEPGGSVDNNGQVADAKYIFAPTDPQMEVVVQVGSLSSPAPMTVTWVQVTDAGDQKLFTDTVQVSGLDRAFSIGKNPGTLAEGDYKIVAALNGQTQQIEVSVAQPPPGGVQSKSQAATTGANPTAGGQPPVDGGSGKTASAASSNMPPAAGNAPASAGCTIPLTVISNVASYFILTVDSSKCPPFVITFSVDGTPIPWVYSIPDYIVPWRVDPCDLSGGKDLPGTKVQLYAVGQGGESFATSPVLAGPWVITLGPDISPPHLDVKSTPERGKKVKKGDKITLNITSEEVRSGESWQMGVQDIQIIANGTLIDSKDYSNKRAKWCGDKSWKQPWTKDYTVPSNPPPVITLCVLTEDFAGNSRKNCGDFPTGDHWTGTIRSTTNADYGKPGTCNNEKWLFKFDVYVAADGTIVGKGTGQLTSPAQCHLPDSPDYGNHPAHNAAFDISGKLDGQNFQLFFTETYIDDSTPGLINYSLLESGTPIAKDMPPFVFSITGQGSAGGIVKIAYTPATVQQSFSVDAEHIVDMKCLDCGKP
jgi:hypothetical protein